MSEYIKPVVLDNADLAEGVYAASGVVPIDAATASNDEPAICWSGYAESTQKWNGSHHVYEITAHHSTKVQHISSAFSFSIDVGTPVVDAYSENGWECTFSGNVVHVTRPSHANAYGSGDTAGGFKVWIKAIDQTTTEALPDKIELTDCACTKTVNVQGGGADGN